MQPDGEDGSFEGADLSWIRSDSSLCWGKDRSMMESQNANSVQNRGPTELDRFTDPIPPGMIGLHRGRNVTNLSFVFVAERATTWTDHSPENGVG